MRRQHRRLYNLWTSEEYGDALDKVQHGLSSYLKKLESDEFAAARSINRSAVSVATARLAGALSAREPLAEAELPSDEGSAQQFSATAISADLFALHRDGNFERMARGYLRGASPRFHIAVHAAIARSADVKRLIRLVHDGVPAIQVSAPVAEGLTTTLMQTAHALLSEPNVQLYWCSHGALPKAPPSRAAHILVVDDAHELEELPEWASQYAPDRGGNATIILGCREYAARRLSRTRNLPWVRTRLTAVTADDAESYVSAILRYGAAEHPELDLKALFLNALPSDGSADGGLFPAMFAATRGEMLENRYSRIIEGIDHNDPELDALACLSFCNMAHLGTQWRFGLPTIRLLESVAEHVAGHDTSNRAQLIKDRIRQLPERWDGEIRTRARGGIELRHPSITHIFYRWIFGAAQPPRGQSPRGNVRRHKWDFYEYLLMGLIRDRGQAASLDALKLIENAVHVLVTDFQRRRIGQDALGATSGACLSLIDHTERELEFKDFERASLSVGRARIWAHLSGVESDVEQRQMQVTASVRELNRAVAFAEGDLPVLLQIANVLEDLPQPQTVIFEDGANRNWHDIYKMIIDRAEASGDYSFSDHARRNYLRKLLNARRSATSVYPIDRYERIEIFVRSTSLPTHPDFDKDRLVLLLHLANWAARRYQGDQQVPLGMADDEFPSSRYSVYKAIWRELHRLLVNGRLKRALQSRTLDQQLERTRKIWLADEHFPKTQVAWPAGAATKMVQLLEAADWQALAAEFSAYYPAGSSAL